MAEYETRPGDDFAALLPLSTELVNRLNAWNERYESALGDLGNSSAEWLDEGAELARLVQLEAEQAGEHIQVIYWHDRSRNPRHGSHGRPAPQA